MATEKYRITFEVDSFEGVPKDTIAFGIAAGNIFILRLGSQFQTETKFLSNLSKTQTPIARSDSM